jgi:hypothetical protein
MKATEPPKSENKDGHGRHHHQDTLLRSLRGLNTKQIEEGIQERPRIPNQFLLDLGDHTAVGQDMMDPHETTPKKDEGL